MDDFVDTTASGYDLSLHFIVNCGQRRLAIEAAADTGLICRNRNRKASTVQPGDGIGAAIDRTPLVDRLYEVIGVMVNDAVAIENDQPAQSSAPTFPDGKPGDVGDRMKRRAQLRQQAKPVAFKVFVVGHHHHLVEEAIDG